MRAIVGAEGRGGRDSESARPQRGLQGALARASGITSSYLSQVLAGKQHLTADHALGMAEHLGLDDSEIEYFLTLVQEARANTARLRTRLAAQRLEMKRQHEDFSARFRGAKPVETTDASTLYYSHWNMMALHLLLRVPKFASVDALARRSGLAPRKVQSTLAALAELNLAAQVGGQWHALDTDLHLPKGSPLANVSHTNWRLRAIQKCQDDAGDGLFYTGVHTLSRKDFERVKTLLRNALEATRSLILPSPDEEAIAITCDAFVL